MRTASRVLAAAVLAIVPACTTERVKTDFESLEAALSETSEAIEPNLKPRLEQDRQQEISAAARAGDSWFLSNDCNFTVAGENTVLPSSACNVMKVKVGEREPVIGQATALNRRLNTLKAYVTALGLLMDATLEEEVVSAYSAALAAFGDLGEAGEIDSLLEFIADRQDDKEKEETVISAAIAQLRYNRMRSVVLASEQDFATVAREAQLDIQILNLEPEFASRAEKLRRANDAALIADTGNTEAYRAALVSLETEHAAFMEYFEGTHIYAIGLVSQAHTSLAEVLRRPGSAEDVLSYLESLKALADKLGE